MAKKILNPARTLAGTPFMEKKGAIKIKLAQRTRISKKYSKSFKLKE